MSELDLDVRVVEELTSKMADHNLMQMINYWDTDRIIQALSLVWKMEDARVVRALGTTGRLDDRIAASLIQVWGRCRAKEALCAEWSSLRVDKLFGPSSDPSGVFEWIRVPRADLGLHTTLTRLMEVTREGIHEPESRRGT
jgi:hypothetical protein